MSSSAFRRSAARRPQGGFVLVTGLLFLVILTLLGLAMFRSSGLMDRITANTRDKQRAFEAAQSALQYGEWWLASGNGGMGSACGTQGKVDGNTLSNIHVCSDALAAGFQNASPLMPNAFTYKPPGMTTGSSGGLNASNDINYSSLPGFYIESLGTAPDGVSQVYQVTAYGQGGSSDTTAVVRSTYKVTPSVTCFSCTL